MRRFTGNKSFNSNQLFSTSFLLNKRRAINNRYDYDKELQQQPVANTSSNLNAFAFNETDHTGNLLFILQGFQMIASKSNVVMVAVGGIVWKGLGWKILAITGSLYGLLYLYERLMWTRKTQEKLFKRQYADYASSKLKLIVDLTSQNASSQVQQ
jgi:hypothetical protein